MEFALEPRPTADYPEGHGWRLGCFRQEKSDRSCGLETEVLREGFDQGRDGGGGRFQVGWVSEVAQGLGGDGADRGAKDGLTVSSVQGEFQAGGFEEGEEVGGGGGAGEGDGVGPGFGIGKEGMEEGDRILGDEVAVSRGDGEFGSGRAEGVR